MNTSSYFTIIFVLNVRFNISKIMTPYLDKYIYIEYNRLYDDYILVYCSALINVRYICGILSFHMA